jgi:hypothetical protein
MATFHFKARWRGLRVTRPGNKGDIVFINHRHKTSSEKDAEILRNMDGVFEVPVEPEPETTNETTTDAPEEETPKVSRGRRGGRR